MKIKSSLFFLIFIVTPIMVFGQTYNHPPNNPEYDQQKWHFGFTLGPEFQNFRITNNSTNTLNTNKFELEKKSIYEDEDFVFDYSNAYFYSEVENLSTGFHVGIITSRRLGNYFNLRIIPSLSLGQKTVRSKSYLEFPDELNEPQLKGYDILTDPNTFPYDSVLSNSNLYHTTTIKSTYISLPILLKYKSVRIENARPYIVAGVNFRYDLATDFEDPITLKKIDTSLEFGLGSDFYMQTFRLGVELRFGIGLMNVLQTDRPTNDDMPYITASMDKITAKTFTIAINFE